MTRLEANRSALAAAKKTGKAHGVIYKDGEYGFIPLDHGERAAEKFGWELLYTVKPGD